MRIQGERRLAFPRQTVWEALMDPEVLAGTLPGCRSLEREGDDAFAGHMQVAVGPVRGDFRGRLEMSDLVAPESYSMRLDGRGPSGFLSGEGTVRLDEADGGAATVVRYDLDAQVGGRLAGLGQRLLESSGKAVAQQGLDGLESQLEAAAGGGTEEGREEVTRPQDPAAWRAGARAATKAGDVAEAASARDGTPASSDSTAAGGTVPGGEPRAGGDGPPPGGAGRSAAPPPSQAAFAVGVARQVVRDLLPPEARRFALAGACFVGGLLLGFWMGGRQR